MNVIAKTSWYLECSVITLKLRKEYLNTVTRNTPVLLRIKYWTVWYIDRYSMSTYTGVTNFQKTVRFFGPPCICHSTMDLTRCYKTVVFSHLYLQFFYLNPQPWYQYIDFENKWPLRGIIFPVLILVLLLSSGCDSTSAYKFFSQLDNRWRSCDVILIFQDGRTALHSIADFQFGHGSHLRKSKTVCTPNFNPRLRY